MINDNLEDIDPDRANLTIKSQGRTKIIKKKEAGVEIEKSRISIDNGEWEQYIP